MKRTCLFLVALLALCALFTATAMCNAGEGLFRLDGSRGRSRDASRLDRAPMQAEVQAEIARPEDGNLNYLTVLGDADESIVNQLKSSFPNVHFHHYKSNDPILPRYEKTVGSFPAVVYQQPNGVVIEKLSGDNFPRSQRELTGFVEQCRPFRPRPEPTPPIQPTPPVAPVAPTVVPDTSGTDNSGLPLWLYVILFGGSAAGSAGVQWYKEIKGE